MACCYYTAGDSHLEYNCHLIHNENQHFFLLAESRWLTKVTVIYSLTKTYNPADYKTGMADQAPSLWKVWTVQARPGQRPSSKIP